MKFQMRDRKLGTLRRVKGIYFLLYLLKEVKRNRRQDECLYWCTERGFQCSCDKKTVKQVGMF